MDYAQATYFEGFHFAHIAAWLEAKRLATIFNRHDALIRR